MYAYVLDFWRIDEILSVFGEISQMPSETLHHLRQFAEKGHESQPDLQPDSNQSANVVSHPGLKGGGGAHTYINDEFQTSNYQRREFRTMSNAYCQRL